VLNLSCENKHDLVGFVGQGCFQSSEPFWRNTSFLTISTGSVGYS